MTVPLRPYPEKGMLPPVKIRQTHLQPLIRDGVLVGMAPVHRCPECGAWIGEGDTDCPPGALLLPLKPKRRRTART